MHKITKKIFDRFQDISRKIDKRTFKKLLSQNDKISLVDIGGYGGVQPRWKKIEEYLDLHIFEPNKDEAKNIKANTKKLNIYEHALADKDGEIILNICKNPGVSSVLEPNVELLKKFQDFERFEILKREKVKSKKLDSCNIDNIDFIKLDVQGFTLKVLQGADNSLEKCLGVEVECEFKEIYKNQPLFGTIDDYLIQRNFELIDFIDIVKWSEENNKKNKYKIKSEGEISFVNALYIKKISHQKNISSEKLKSMVIILCLYGQYSKAINIIEEYKDTLGLSNQFDKNLIKLITQVKYGEKINKLVTLIIRMLNPEFKTVLLK